MGLDTAFALAESIMADWSLPTSRRRLSLKLGVFAAVAGLVALLAVSTAVAVLLTLSLREQQAELQHSNVPYARAIATAALTAKAIANDERGYLISGNAMFVTQLEERAGKVRVALAGALRAADGARAASGGRRSLGRVRALAARRARAVRGYRAGQRDASIAEALGPGRALRKSYEASLARAQVLADSAIQSNQESAAATSKRTIAILVGCLLVGLLVGVWLAVCLVRAILEPGYRRR